MLHGRRPSGTTRQKDEAEKTLNLERERDLKEMQMVQFNVRRLSETRNMIYKLRIYSWALVAHSCNPSFSGGRNQDGSLKPPRANTS
jgi:hypothetical protein